MKACNKCSAQLPDEALYCNKCGTKQEVPSFCIYCGTQTPEDVTVCAECGKNLEMIAAKKNDLDHEADSIEGFEAFDYTKLSNGRFGIIGLRDKDLKQVVVPNDVEFIGESAFEGTGIIRVTLPEGLLEIGNGAFKNCKRLIDVNIPSSVAVIGDNAFEECGNLEIIVPKTVRIVGEKAIRATGYSKQWWSFKHIFELVENMDGSYRIKKVLSTEIVRVIIPKCVTVVGSQAFNSCKKLSNVIIPESVNSIEAHAFLDCQSLTGITIPESVTRIDETAFDKNWLTCIRGKKESYAEEFAALMDIEFEALEDEDL